MQKLNPWVLVGIAGYALVIGVGLIGILAIADAGEAGGYVAAWLSFAGVGGMIGAVLGQVSTVKSEVESLTNGDMEAAVRKAVAVEITKFAAQEQAAREGTRWRPPTT